MGPFNNYVDKMRGRVSVFVHAQGIKTVHAGGEIKKWQNSVHVVVECPLLKRPQKYDKISKLVLTVLKVN